jgi:Mrp family chromosome partitioning ATPase
MDKEPMSNTDRAIDRSPTEVMPGETTDTTPARAPQRAGQKVRAAGKRRASRCQINLQAMAERGFLVPNEGRSQLAREMRRIKRPLLLDVQRMELAERADGSAPANIIMLTSALPGEGKTYTSTNLAVSIAAELDRSVLLVDADVAKRDLTRQFGLLDFPGFADTLRPNGPHPDEVTLKTNIERLEILPCGRQSDDIDELYASNLMDKTIRALAREETSRIVLMDGPPILVTTEAAVLVHNVAQAVLVVEANKTPQDAINHALAPLLDHPCVRLILNKTTRGIGSGYGYGYGYGYTYGDGGEDRLV